MECTESGSVYLKKADQLFHIRKRPEKKAEIGIGYIVQSRIRFT
jgi:hypothetical protein